MAEKTTKIICIGDFAPVSQGFAVKWLKCRKCGEVYRYVYQPYSLGNPQRWTVCGHSVTHRDLNCDEISEQEADKYFRKRHKESQPQVRKLRKPRRRRPDL